MPPVYPAPTATTRKDLRMSRATVSIQDSPSESLMVMFRIISRRSWDELQGWHEAFPESRVEHVMKGTGIFVLHVPSGGARRLVR